MYRNQARVSLNNAIGLDTLLRCYTAGAGRATFSLLPQLVCTSHLYHSFGVPRYPRKCQEVKILRSGWRAAWGSKLRRKEILFGYAGLIPYTVGLLVFTAGPLVYSLWLSFNRYDVLTPPVLVGFDNYSSRLIGDPLFRKSLSVTAIYSIVSVPLGMIIGYSTALLLNQSLRGLSFWRTVYFLPAIVPGVAATYLFAWLFNADMGLANSLLKAIGVQGPNWFGDPQWALRTFVIMSLWASGGGMIIYLASLQAVPTAFYDAAKIDGANAWQRLWNVTLPMTSPTILFMFIMGLIGSFQTFMGSLHHH